MAFFFVSSQRYDGGSLKLIISTYLSTQFTSKCIEYHGWHFSRGQFAISRRSHRVYSRLSFRLVRSNVSYKFL